MDGTKLFSELKRWGYRRVLFVGDSVTAQHECDFRCRLAPWFMNAFVDKNGTKYYRFQSNVTVAYEEAGGWGYCGPSPQGRTAMQKADLVIFNIGNHFGSNGAGSMCPASTLPSWLQQSFDTFRVARRDEGVAFVFRTQNPYHFNTPNSRYDGNKIRPGCVPLVQTSFWADPRNNYEYNAGMTFARRNQLPVLDVFNISNSIYGHHFHPGTYAKTPGQTVTDCLHICQNSDLLSAWSGDLLRILSRGLLSKNGHV